MCFPTAVPPPPPAVQGSTVSPIPPPTCIGANRASHMKSTTKWSILLCRGGVGAGGSAARRAAASAGVSVWSSVLRRASVSGLWAPQRAAAAASARTSRLRGAIMVGSLCTFLFLLCTAQTNTQTCNRLQALPASAGLRGLRATVLHGAGLFRVGHAWTCPGMHGHAWTCMDMHGHAWTGRHSPPARSSPQSCMVAERAARPRKCAAPAGGKPHRSVLRPAKVAQTLGTRAVQVPLPGGRLPNTPCPAAAGPAHGTVLSPLSRRQKHGGA